MLLRNRLSLMFMAFASMTSSGGVLPIMLRKALAKNQLTPYVQPIYNAQSGTVMGGEVLMRWHHPRRGMISPEQFIPLAEQNGLITRITQYALQHVAKEIIANNSIHLHDMTLFFNVSAADFKNNEILRECRAFIQKTQRTDLHIGLEITEREPVHNTSMAQGICEQLEALGVTISIDDFGTGHSNYHYLMQFCPRYIKIDKLFTSGIDTDTTKEIIVRNIIAIARDMNCMTIAEGVETAAQKEKLTAMGVTHLQGYYFSRPVEMSTFFTLAAQPSQ